MAHEECKTKYLFEIMMLVVLVSYFWLDQLICIAREKCKIKYLLEIMMLVVVVSYIIGLNSCYVLPMRSARPTDMYGCEKFKTKYNLMMLMVVVSYLWLEQLIPIAREKCKTKY
ncbi:hypothetical protein DPMN_122127 [Dreissena polymorpha]|uniref:Uncharacterized protein n=1 Tax=Dreissena polymorpha TaxID=45954 RepID=A0A9D4GMZ7_DREPO|nr:hypothetical protein DPMN_122127 [Dreissena polymorpha]